MSSPFAPPPSAREVRRALDRDKKRKVKPQRESRHISGQVSEAVMRTRIEEKISRLRTGSALHAYTGANAAMLANLAGRLVYVVCHAAGHHGLGESPEARILAGTANALAEIAESPQALEQQRGAVISGLAAIDRLMPELSTWALAAGALQLDQLLASTAGMGTADVRRALGMRAA